MSKTKTVRPGVREISPMSIYGEVYGGKDLRKRKDLRKWWFQTSNIQHNNFGKKDFGGMVELPHPRQCTVRRRTLWNNAAGERTAIATDDGNTSWCNVPRAPRGWSVPCLKPKQYSDAGGASPSQASHSINTKNPSRWSTDVAISVL